MNDNSISKLFKLDKPLVIFDLETTGLVLSMDRIIELAYIKIYPDGKDKNGDIFLNPEIEISEEASAVHGIKDEDLKDKPTFREKSQEIWDIFAHCYYGGFNVINFDLPLLKREFLRVGMDFEYDRKDIIDSKMIYHYMEPRDLSAAYKYYCQKEHKNAHSALEDVRVTAEILKKQLEKYEGIRDWGFINQIHNPHDDRYVDNDRKFYWRNGEAYFAFSKFKDMPLKKIALTDRGFLEWMLGADFSEESKSIVAEALRGQFPEKKKN